MGAQGVSLASCILAMATQIFAAAYSIAEEHPFSSYGEAFPQHLCTLTVALQCLRYNFYFSYAKLLQSAGTGLGLAYVLCRAKFFLGRRLGRQSASMLQSSVPALTFCEKIPQVVQTWLDGSSGELSIATNFMAWLGNMLRCYTSLKQLDGDRKALRPHVISFALNSSIMAQLLCYSRKKSV